MTVAAPPSLRVSGDALPTFADLTPTTGQPYDAALALTATAINQLLAVGAAEAARSIDVTEEVPAAVVEWLSQQIQGLPAFVRLEIPTAPVLTGAVLCPEGLALPELQLANGRVIFETEIDGNRGAVVTMSFDLRAGLRLWPRADDDGRIGLGVDLVAGPACPGTQIVPTVISIPNGFDETSHLFALALMGLGPIVSAAIPPLPFDELLPLDGLAGLPLVTLGFQPVEIVNAGGAFAVYANLLVDGQGGSLEPLALVSSRFEDGVDGWSFLLGSLTHVASGGPAGTGDAHVHGVPDAESLTSYYVAPGKFLGDWSRYTRLMLEMESSGGSYYDSDFGYRGDVYLESGAYTAQYDFGHRPASSWEPFSVPLGSSAGWTFGGGATSLVEVLRNVTRFEIRGEYGYGGDDSRLDDVRLVLDY